MTQPLTDPEVDLRGLPWMPLDVVRLLDSDLFAIATGDEFKAAVALWCKSWWQQPAGSLPDDDRVLAALSGAGKEWAQVREVALRNWIHCDDGRLYHPTVAEAAAVAWEKRVADRERRDAQAERKRQERAERATLFDALKAAGITPPYNTPTHKLRAMAEKVTDLSRGQSDDSHGVVTAKTGTGTGTVRAKKYTPSGVHARAREGAAAAGDVWRELESAGIPVGIIARTRHGTRITQWLDRGLTLEQLREAISRAQAARETAQDHAPLNLGFIDCHLQDVLAGEPTRAERRGGFEHGDELGRRFAAGEG